jgi:hypothetical protein
VDFCVSFAQKLTVRHGDGSPAYLDPNGVILHLDSLPIRQAAHVLKHRSETIVTFLDHRSNHHPFQRVNNVW